MDLGAIDFFWFGHSMVVVRVASLPVNNRANKKTQKTQNMAHFDAHTPPPHQPTSILNCFLRKVSTTSYIVVVDNNSSNDDSFSSSPGKMETVEQWKRHRYNRWIYETSCWQKTPAIDYRSGLKIRKLRGIRNQKMLTASTGRRRIESVCLAQVNFLKHLWPASSGTQ